MRHSGRIFCLFPPKYKAEYRKTDSNIPVWEEVVPKRNVMVEFHRRCQARRCIKYENSFTTLFTLNHNHLLSFYSSPMAHAPESQQYLSVYDPNPRSRQPSGLLGSIWAPQPQPSETTWPRTLDSFSRVAEKEAEQSSSIESGALQPIISREDVFGPQQPAQMISREIGAIGDGRKKNSPDYEDKVCAFICVFFSSIMSLSETP